LDLLLIEGQEAASVSKRHTLENRLVQIKDADDKKSNREMQVQRDLSADSRCAVRTEKPR